MSPTKNLQFYDKKSVSVWQPSGIDSNMMLLKNENLKELSHSDIFVFCFVLFSLLELLELELELYFYLDTVNLSDKIMVKIITIYFNLYKHDLKI